MTKSLQSYDHAAYRSERSLISRAYRCRELAASCDDQRTAHTLTLIAEDYEQQASTLTTSAEQIT